MAPVLAETTPQAWFQSGVIPPAGAGPTYWTDNYTLFASEMVLMGFAELRRLQDFRKPGSMGKQARRTRVAARAPRFYRCCPSQIKKSLTRYLNISLGDALPPHLHRHVVCAPLLSARCSPCALSPLVQTHSPASHGCLRGHC